jgi:succinate dehydrogenase / fumarate reductase, cytochrome b subunit
MIPSRPKRPVFLDLWRIRLPMAGVVSILHRVSGVLMVLTIPVAAVQFHQALSGPAGFAASVGFLGQTWVKLALLVLVWGLLHHLLAGVRHLLLDIGYGLNREAARRSAWVTLLASLAAAVLVFARGMLA